jgi:hypothetical protein
MALIILGGILPAIFLVGIGQAFQPTPGEQDQSSNWTGFLLSALLFLLGATLLSYLLLGDPGSYLLILLLPAAMGVMAQTILWLVEARLGGLFRSRGLLALLLADLILLAVLEPLTDGFFGLLVPIGGLLLALTWKTWELLGRAWIAVYLLILVLGLAAGWRLDLNRDVFAAIPWLAGASGMLAYLFVVIEILAVFRLLHGALADESYPNGRRLLQAGLLALPILGMAGWQTATAAAWDVATDGLGGIMMVMIAGVTGIAAAVLTAWAQPVSRRSLPFILALVLPLYMSAWMSFGTFGLDGPWGRVPIARTERRADSIDRAIRRFYLEKGSYPVALDELTPRYLLILPTPFIIPGQDWCYQGGADYYRLGYVYREYFSTPAEVRVFASQGPSPDPSWPCEQEAARYPGPPGFLGGE